jgi:hypothetical protein
VSSEREVCSCVELHDFSRYRGRKKALQAKDLSASPRISKLKELDLPPSAKKKNFYLLKKHTDDHVYHHQEFVHVLLLGLCLIEHTVGSLIGHTVGILKINNNRHVFVSFTCRYVQCMTCVYT